MNVIIANCLMNVLVAIIDCENAHWGVIWVMFNDKTPDFVNRFHIKPNDIVPDGEMWVSQTSFEMLKRTLVVEKPKSGDLID